MAGLLKLVFTGPESTGKSVVAKELSQHWQCHLVPEFARHYLEEHGNDYNFELLCKISRWHWEYQQEHTLKAHRLIILDTDLINYLVWQQLLFAKTDPWLMGKIKQEQDHRYLITYYDLPWAADPLRDSKADRANIFNHHLQEVKSRGRTYRILRGLGASRLQNAIQLSQELLPEISTKTAR